MRDKKVKKEIGIEKEVRENKNRKLRIKERERK